MNLPGDSTFNMKRQFSVFGFQFSVDGEKLLKAKDFNFGGTGFPACSRQWRRCHQNFSLRDDFINGKALN